MGPQLSRVDLPIHIHGQRDPELNAGTLMVWETERDGASRINSVGRNEISRKPMSTATLEDSLPRDRHLCSEIDVNSTRSSLFLDPRFLVFSRNMLLGIEDLLLAIRNLLLGSTNLSFDLMLFLAWRHLDDDFLDLCLSRKWFYGSGMRSEMRS